jgi:hypothetical protein
MTALGQTIEDIFYGQVIVPYGLALVAFQLIVLVLAVRRRRRAGRPLSVRLHVIAGLSILLMPILIGLSVHAARATMLGVDFNSFGGDPSEKAAALSRGMSGQMSAIPFAVSVIGVALVLWFAGMLSTLSAPETDGRMRSLPPAVLVIAALGPLAVGVLRWSISLVTAFAAMAGMPPEDKPAFMEHSLDAARAELSSSARASMIAIPILAVVALILIRARARGGGGEADAVGKADPWWRRWLLASCAAVLLAALLVIQARPMAAENETPWPPNLGNQLVYPDGPATPDLVGPDTARRGTVVELFRDRIMLDRALVQDFESLELKLGTLRNNYQLLNPGGRYADSALVIVDAQTPRARLIDLLKALRGAWYYHPTLGFVKAETHLRPLLGRIDRTIVTAAQIRLAYSDDEPDADDADDADDASEWKNAAPLRAQDFADYGELARRVVELRRAGKSVLVYVSRPAR